MVRLKVCCIQDEVELERAVRYGASAVGLVSAMPSGPGPIPDDAIARLARRVPPGVDTFLLTCLTEADALIEQQHRLGVQTLQLVDRIESRVYPLLRGAIPGVRLVQVIHVAGLESVDEARAVAPEVDAILLDSGRPDAAVKELGGTGRTHDWALSRKVVEAVDVPVYLAGGLRPDNVAEAVRAVGAFGVDLCSGIRTASGRLDEDRLRAFTEALWPR